MILNKIIEYVTLISKLSKSDLISAADLKNEFDNISYHALLRNFKEWKGTGHLSERRTDVEHVQRVKFGLTLKGMIVVKTMFFTCLQAMEGLIGRNKIALSPDEKTILSKSIVFNGFSQPQTTNNKKPHRPKKKINFTKIMEQFSPQIKSAITDAIKDAGIPEYVTSDLIEQAGEESTITIVDNLISLLEKEEKKASNYNSSSKESIKI